MWFKRKQRVLESISDKKLAHIGNRLVELLRRHGGPNYLSLTFVEEETEETFEVLIKKFKGKTPSERVMELEQEIKSIKND